MRPCHLHQKAVALGIFLDAIVDSESETVDNLLDLLEPKPHVAKPVVAQRPVDNLGSRKRFRKVEKVAEEACISEHDVGTDISGA